MPRGRRGRRPRPGPTSRNNRAATGPRLSIKSVDMLVVHNQQASNTDEFESDQYMVVRRGNSVDVVVTFSAPVESKKVTIEFHRGRRARTTRGTKFIADCGKRSRHFYEWEMKVVNDGGDKIRYSVEIPPDAPIGSYITYVTAPVEGRNVTRFQMDRETVILFNPWCKDDSVYMPNESEREEYVMNETGLIWAGTSNSKFTWAWNFAQFETTCLEAMLFMLDRFDISSDARRSPIYVAKALTEMVNVNDADGGCLVGKWSGNDEDYADGTMPTAWSGSEAILKQYLDTRRPVKYGQCWVFGGTLTTTLRTVGIPSRPVTNFDSAHDANSNRAIDQYFDIKGDFLPDKSDDSIWNYHVWVEGWMSRPDLDGSYGGWQALDATPQELSPHTATMVVGPAPLAAIKDGLNKPYDCEFVISEVNADIKYYQETPDHTFEQIGADTVAVGDDISTKAVGSSSRNDVTDAYKYREGTAAERAALGAKRSTEGVPKGGVLFQMAMSVGKKVGEEVICEVKLTSQDAVKPGGVQVTMTAKSIQYTGMMGKQVTKDTRTVWASGCSANTDTILSFSIKPSQYLELLGEQPLIGVTVLAYVKPTQQAWIKKQSCRLNLPDVNINVDGKGGVVLLKAGTKVNAVASIVNPLNKPMTDIVFFVEGAGLLSPQTIPSKDTPAGKTAQVTFSLTPRQNMRKKKATLIVTCQSRLLKGIMGTATITIIKN